MPFGRKVVMAALGRKPRVPAEHRRGASEIRTPHTAQQALLAGGAAVGAAGGGGSLGRALPNIPAGPKMAGLSTCP